MYLLRVLVLVFFPAHFFSQYLVVRGKIIDQKKEAIPFANIYVKGTTNGVTSNEKGYFNIKLTKGTYTLVVQHIGYGKKEVPLMLNSDDIELEVILLEEGVSLKEVVVKAGENPANIIMRNAIKKRKYYLKQVNNYSCKAYIKGLQRLNHVSKKMMKLIKLASDEVKDSTDLLGVLYLSESHNEFYYGGDTRIKEVMRSSKVSGSSKSFSFNQYRYLNYNFYENLIKMQDVSNRPFISPLNNNAFLYYRFKLLGSYFEDGKEVNKIEVIPKRETDPVFSGIIYIQENSWRITGLNLFLTKKNKINFVDTVRITQLHTPVWGDTLWMPQSSNFEFVFTFMGFSGNGYFNTVLSDYNFSPNFSTDFFSEDLVVIEKDANKKDSAWWAQNRPIPLTQEEKNDYRKKDSIAAKVEDPTYIDSVDRRKSRFKLINLWNGYTYERRNKGLRIQLPGISDAGVQYNTVEGINLSYNFSLYKTYENLSYHLVQGKARYGFSNRLAGGELSWTHLFDHNNFRSFGVYVKSIVEQYNRNKPIGQFVNTVYTLFLNENYMKLYREGGAGFFIKSELYKGINARVSVDYFNRQPLFNTTDLLIIDNKEKLFTSNDPLHPSREDLLFKQNDVLLTEIQLRFRFKQRYYNIAGNRFYAHNRFPKLSVLFRRAVPLNARSADFDLLAADLHDELSLGLLGVFMYHVKGGMYTRVKKIYYMDYKHFNGNQTIIIDENYMNSFRLLPYYSLSTRRWYAESHIEQHFNGFILNKIPGINRLFVQEVAGLHVLINDRVNNYYEVNVGLKNIFRFLRVDYAISFQGNKKMGQGILFGFNSSF